MLPFVLLGAAAIAGLVGGIETAEAIDKFNQAKRIAEEAEGKYNKKKSQVEKKLNNLNSSLQNLGKLYLEIYTKDFKNFVKFLEEVDISLDIKSKPKELRQWKEELPTLKTQIDLFEKVLGGALKGTAKAGFTAALTYFGATSLAVEIGTASTGTALSALSGAALDNALLAWFGGGSLATGGLGAAGGAFVLGGIVVGPAICIAGITLSKKAEEALTQAKKYRNQVSKAVAQMTEFENKVRIVQEKVDEELEVLPKLRRLFNNEFKEAQKLFRESKNFPWKKALFEKHLNRSLILGKAIVDLIKVPLITDKDKFIFNPERGKALENAKQIVRNSHFKTSLY